MEYKRFGNKIIVRIDKDEEILEPVSYTHLDVYKRQPLLITSTRSACAAPATGPSGPATFRQGRAAPTSAL